MYGPQYCAERALMLQLPSGCHIQIIILTDSTAVSGLVLAAIIFVACSLYLLIKCPNTGKYLRYMYLAHVAWRRVSCFWNFGIITQ